MSDNVEKAIKFLNSLTVEDNVSHQTKGSPVKDEYYDGCHDFIIYTNKADEPVNVTIFLQDGSFDSVVEFHGIGIDYSEDDIPPKLEYYYPEGDKECEVWGLPGYQGCCQEGKTSREVQRAEWEEFVT